MPANYPKPRTFTYKVDENGCAIDCDVYVPQGQTGPFPVIIWMHYSGLVFENRHTVGTHMFHSGPKRGYVVVNIDYRLAPQAKIWDIYKDVEDCAVWVREKLGVEFGNKDLIDPERLVIGGGSCGAQLALTAGLYLQPPPKAVVSLYALCDPVDPAFTTATKPKPPPGRDELIKWDEVKQYLDDDAPMVSHPEIGCDVPSFTYYGRAAAYFYMLQEGTYLKSVYGDLSIDEIRAKWSIPSNVTDKFPPTFVAHAQQDRYVPHTESEKLVGALEKAGVKHHWWSVPGKRDHGFDATDMEAGEEGEFDQEFASRMWPWLDEVVKP